MKQILAALILAMISGSAYAGPRVGNGGDILLCTTAGKQSAELLDHYEARTIRGITLNLGAANDSVDVKIQRVFDKLKVLDRTRALLYQEWYQSFATDAFLTDGNISQIPDTGAVTFPKNCEIQQIAIHQDPDIPGDHRYIIRKDLWNLLDNNGRAGLVLHELIYRDLVSQPVGAHASSKFARYFNAYLSSDDFSKLNLFSYYQLLLKLNFASMDAQYGLPIMILKDSPAGVVPATVKISDINNLVEYAELPAPLRVPLSYTWHGTDLPVVEGVCSLQPRSFLPNGLAACIDTNAHPLDFDIAGIKGSVYWDEYMPSLNLSDDKILTVNRYCDDERYQNGVYPELTFEGTAQGAKVQVDGQGLMVDYKNGKALKTRRETSLCVDAKYRVYPGQK